MDALDCIMSRRSIRHYSEEPVTEGQIQMALKAAMAAPSAGNQQPWRFIVLTEREALTAAAACTPYGRMLLEAPLGLVICADTNDLKHPQMWEQDCAAAVQNVLLAVHAAGLGAVWLGFWPKMERVTPLKEALGIPEGVQPLAVIAIGHPAEVKPSLDRYDADFVHRERW